MTKNKWYLASVFSATLVASAAAAHAGPGHFAKLDKDGNGAVTTQEFESGLLERFARSDANQDGKVTADELKARFAEHKQERFEKRDENGNGVLERAELGKMPDELFARLDSDNSWTLTKDELANKRMRHGKHAEKMKKLPGDADGDGVVTKAEAVSGAAEFAKRIDADGDGKLTKEEFKAMRGKHHRGQHGHHGRSASQ